MEPYFPVAAGFLLVLSRAGALAATAPLYGMKVVPARVRMAVAVALAVVAFTAAGTPGFAAWERADALIMAFIVETVLGLAGGLAARFALDAAAAAGHAIGLGMGLGFGAVVDPLHGAESTAISELLSILALGIAVATGLHRDAVAWLCRSVIEAPPGARIALGPVAAGVVGEAAQAAALSVRLAFPVLAAVTVGHLGLGVLTKSAPQLGPANIGFSVAILAGGGALYLLSPMLAESAARAARAVFTGGS
jgi:flagellar biosynthetic protein FliR